MNVHRSGSLLCLMQKYWPSLRVWLWELARPSLKAWQLPVEGLLSLTKAEPTGHGHGYLAGACLPSLCLVSGCPEFQRSAGSWSRPCRLITILHESFPETPSMINNLVCVCAETFFFPLLTVLAAVCRIRCRAFLYAVRTQVVQQHGEYQRVGQGHSLGMIDSSQQNLAEARIVVVLSTCQ